MQKLLKVIHSILQILSENNERGTYNEESHRKRVS